jgi:glycosyltransferase involved in cell wall biosynthesis
MKKVLCISPHFPPVNAADMHRLRQSLSYFRDFGWEPVVFAVYPEYVEQSKDNLLLDSIPKDIEIHHVKAFPVKWTRKLGLGNLGFRSWIQYRNAVGDYIEKNKVDLIYFSTTVFSLMSLGVFWKKKCNVPFVIDLQDPWRNDYYLTIDKRDRPKKFWFDYQQKKILEALTMPRVDGIISVSEGYIDLMKERYPQLAEMHCTTLPFGALEVDMEIANQLKSKRTYVETLDIVYVGRGGKDMEFSLATIFKAFAKGLEIDSDSFSRVRFKFIGTSYAAKGQGQKTIIPIAERFLVESYVEENTNRLSYYESLRRLLDADMLFIPGSSDENYTASKIFPYILAGKPLIAVFHEKSSVVDIVQSTQSGDVITFNQGSSLEGVSNEVFSKLSNMISRIPFKPETDWKALTPYTAKEMSRKQCVYFDEIVTCN